jgi:hypothetical protein
MAIDQVSSVSTLDAYRQAAAAGHRSPDVTADAVEAAAQESDARRVAESVSGASPAYLTTSENRPVSSGVGTRTEVVATAADPAGSLEQANREIVRASASAAPSASDRIAAEEAYRAQAQARADLELAAQQGGARSLDITV